MARTRSFQPRFWPTVITAVLLGVLLALGHWQVERLHWKQNLLATIDERIHQPPVDVMALAHAREGAYRPVTASGLFQNDHVFYLFGISLTGEGGYHVLTPLWLENGKFLLVDRGWIPYDHKGNFSQPAETAKLAGLLRLPEHHWLDHANNPARGEWYTIDLDAMAKQAGIPAFLPYVLEADATPNAGGYPVGGQTRVTIPNNHFVYALTWYGLAVALLVIYGVSSLRKKDAEG